MTPLRQYAFSVALALAAHVLAPVAASANPVPVTVTITSVECTQAEECDAAGIEAAGQSWPDFYARVFIDGVSADTNRAEDDQEKVEPFGWTVSRTLDDATPPAPLIPITIQIWDHDSTNGDDLADASPKPGNNNLGLILDLSTGRWSGDTTTSCVTGDGVDDDDEYYPVKVCFDISVASTTGDLDGDGLLDGWETSGLDVDGDGTIDVDLPAMGASPTRQDVFLELDYEIGRAPTRDGINAMRRAFAAAPRPNPDGTTGITLHVDAGPLIDAGADEAGRAGTCTNLADDDGDGLSDGLDTTCRNFGTNVDTSREVGVGDCGTGGDEDGDGLANSADPQCLVGDNLGGGELLPTVGACGLDGAFAATKTARFASSRAWVFHYAIQAAAPNPPPPAPPLGCLGGQGELGGNDFISHNLDAGTLMHELGHNLNLDHGGSNPMNCKPSYLSVMNYNLQGGIPRNGGGFILDYSPPRLALDGTTRAAAPLATLVENALSETVQVDLADGSNGTVFMDGLNRIVTVPANALPNWTGDATLPGAAGVNIDNGIPATPTTPGVGQPGCANPDLNSTLAGDNDWARLVLAFRQFAASAEGALIPYPEETPTQEELEQLQQDIRRTDLSVVLSATPDPVAAGTSVAYTATVTNEGPNPALAVLLDLAVPPETTRAGAPPAGCTEPAPGTLSCDLGTLLASESRTVAMGADVPPSLVYDAGAPFTITASANVADRAGTDPDLASNNALAPVLAVAVADLSLVGLHAPNPPLRMRTGEQVVVELGSTIGSAGPSSPMDTALTLTATADAGAIVSPTLLATGQVALRDGEARAMPSHPILFCRTPGRHVWTFAHGIDPARAPDTDPAPANDASALTISVECEGRQDVVVNLEPGRFPNLVIPGARESTLAILTTAPGEYGRVTGFDAANVDVDSVRIGSRRMLDGSEPGTTDWGSRLDDAFEAILPETVLDGDRDLAFGLFDPGLRLGDTEVCVMGTFRDPATSERREFFGCDAAVMRN